MSIEDVTFWCCPNQSILGALSDLHHKTHGRPQRYRIQKSRRHHGLRMRRLVPVTVKPNAREVSRDNIGLKMPAKLGISPAARVPFSDGGHLTSSHLAMGRDNK